MWSYLSSSFPLVHLNPSPSFSTLQLVINLAYIIDYFPSFSFLTPSSIRSLSLSLMTLLHPALQLSYTVMLLPMPFIPSCTTTLNHAKVACSQITWPFFPLLILMHWTSILYTCNKQSHLLPLKLFLKLSFQSFCQQGLAPLPCHD